MCNVYTYYTLVLSLPGMLFFFFFYFLPVVEQYIGTFDVSVKEVVLMAVVQPLH